MNIFKKVVRFFGTRTYRKTVQAQASALVAAIEVAENIMLDPKVEKAVIDCYDANKEAIKKIDWQSIEDMLKTLGQVGQKATDSKKSTFDMAREWSERAKATLREEPQE